MLNILNLRLMRDRLGLTTVYKNYITIRLNFIFHATNLLKTNV